MNKKSKWRHLSLSEKVFTIGTHAIISLWTLLIIVPIWYVFMVTFSADISLDFRLWPSEFTLMHYQTILNTGMIVTPLINSVYVTTVSVLISMVLTTMIAYPLARKALVGVSFLNFLIVFPMMWRLGLLPGYMLVVDLGLMNSYWALILPGAITTTNILILRNFYSGIPDSLIESAQIDGASEMTILWKIMIPLSKPSIASVALFYMVDNWNEYFNVVLFIRDRSRQTLQVILRQIVMENENASGLMAGVYATHIQYAVVVVAMIPILAVYPFVQRYFTKGVLMGSVKG